MKNWKLTLLAAAAALGLQACDVSVQDKPGAETASTSQTAPAPTASTETTAPATTTAAAPTDSSTPSTDASGTMAAQTPPASPDTGAMGASGTAPLGTAPAAPTSSDGMAAPTELARFLQENPVKPRDPQAAAGTSDEAKSGATKAEGKSDSAAKSSKS